MHPRNDVQDIRQARGRLISDLLIYYATNDTKKSSFFSSTSYFVFVLSIESDRVLQIDFSKLITDFAEVK